MQHFYSIFQSIPCPQWGLNLACLPWIGLSFTSCPIHVYLNSFRLVYVPVASRDLWGRMTCRKLLCRNYISITVFFFTMRDFAYSPRVSHPEHAALRTRRGNRFVAYNRFVASSRTVIAGPAQTGKHGHNEPPDPLQYPTGCSRPGRPAA